MSLSKAVPIGSLRYRVSPGQPVYGAERSVAVSGPEKIPGPSESRPVGVVADELAERVIHTLMSLEAALNEAEQRRQSSADELRLVAVELAVAIAARARAGSAGGEVTEIEDMVNDAVKRFSSEAITVALNPDDLDELMEALDGRPPPWSQHPTPRLTADPELSRGDCDVLGTDFHYVRRMEVVLDEIRIGLLDSLENAEIERRRTQAADSKLRRFPDRRETA